MKLQIIIFLACMCPLCKGGVSVKINEKKNSKRLPDFFWQKSLPIRSRIKPKNLIAWHIVSEIGRGITTEKTYKPRPVFEEIRYIQRSTIPAIEKQK